MATENSFTSNASTESSEQISDATERCAICDWTLDRRSQHSAPNRQIKLYGCSECRIGAMAVVDLQGSLSARCTDRLEQTQRRARTGLNVYRIAAFITDGLPSGRFTVKRVDEYQVRIGLPETASQWDGLRLVDSIAVGPLSAERLDGAISVADKRWSSGDEVGHPDVVADGGILSTRGNSGGVRTSPSDPFVVATDDEPRIERAKTEDMDVSLLKKGGIYEVHSASDSYYEVDVAAGECSCPDTADRCKHLRRVAIEIEAGLVPRPDGRLPSRGP